MPIEFSFFDDVVRAAVEDIRNEGSQRVNGLIHRWAWASDPIKRKHDATTLHDILSMDACSDRQKELIKNIIREQKRLDGFTST